MIAARRASAPALRFFNGDGAVFAHFHAGFAAQAFFTVDGVGLAVLEFIHFHGAHVDALAAADAVVGIPSSIVTHFVLQ